MSRLFAFLARRHADQGAGLDAVAARRVARVPLNIPVAQLSVALALLVRLLAVPALAVKRQQGIGIMR